MKNSFLSRIAVTVLMVMLFVNVVMATSGTITFTVHGVITDEETKQPLIGAVVLLHDGTAGTVTDATGRFSLDVTSNDERGLVDISYVGYEKKTVSVANDGKELQMTLHMSQVMVKAVVVSASKIPERIMESPVTIEKITAEDIKETPSNNFYESVANLKEVDMVTNGIAFKTINMRGFSNTENPGFVQLVDGMDNQAPGLNYSVGYGINDLDVDNVELIPGAASALYGANAFDGIMNVTSKDPFKYQGISFQEKVGVNHVDGIDHKPAPLNDFELRFARALNPHFAFKVNAEYFQGTDWIANDTTDISANKTPGMEGIHNPAYQGVNVYGDEVNAPLPIGPGGSPVVISRTGYAEKDLASSNSSYVKYDGSVYYRFNDKTELSYTYRSSLTNSVLESADRYALQGFGLTQQKVEFKAPDFLFRAYTNGESSGNSYDTRLLAINMDEGWKNSNQWFTDYATAYMGGANGVAAGNYAAATDYANIGRPLPGSVRFNQLRDSIEALSVAHGGGGFDDHTRLYNAEAQYNLSDKIKFVDVLMGSSFRYFNLNSAGTLYTDTVGNPLNYYEYGTYMQVGKKLLNNKLKLSATLRYDKSENYQGQFSPRFSAVYDLGNDNFLRASYQTGFRMPTSQDQYIDLNLGGERVIGGLPSVVNPFDVIGKVFTVQSVTNYGNAVADYMAAHPTDSTAAAEAVQKYKNQLVALDYNYVKPERKQSVEIGFKGLSPDKKLFYDLSTYYTINHDFIGYYTVVRPQTGGSKNADSVTAAAYSLIDPSQVATAYLLTTNLPGTVNTYGVALSLGYHLPGDYVLSANATYSKLDAASSDSAASTMFNTPTYKTNVAFSNRNVFKNVGFAINWRWTDSYLWESLFGNGMLTAANNLDVQVSYRFPKVATTLKVGATNALDYRHTDVYGGGTTGAIYYVALRYDGLFK